MAKNMARIENGVVVNIEWCSDKVMDSDVLVSVYDKPVTIGDTYDGTDFYHDGEKVLTEEQILMIEVVDYETALKEIEAALGV